jgi:uncharacterized membrane protein
MKKLLIILAFLLAPFAASAQGLAGWTMEDFEALYEISPDGTLYVTEKITANFTEPRRGIFREVPYSGTDTAGKPYEMKVRLLRVTDASGNAYQAHQTKENGNHKWRIGDPNVTFTGRKTYHIVYSVVGAIGRFEAHDEFYWNVTGSGWDVPLPNAKAIVKLPFAVSGEDLKTVCYSGPYGSTSQDCTQVVAGDQAGFVATKAGDPLTIVVGWPKGLVAATNPAGTFAERFFALLMTFLTVLYYLSPIAVLMGTYMYWKRYGDDKPFGAIVPQHEPPAGMGPAEIVGLLGQQTENLSVTPTIVDLASRGYIRIIEIEKNMLEKWMSGRDFEVELLKPFKEDPSVKEYERDLLEPLVGRVVGHRTKLSSLSKTFHTEVKLFRGLVKNRLKDLGMIETHSLKASENMRIKGFAIVLLGVIIMYVARIQAIPMLLSGAILLIFSVVMPKWTEAGAMAASHARGFKHFIQKVEKYRAPWMEEQNIFEKVLPYAIAFGLGKKWTAAFAGLAIKPPEWFQAAGKAGVFSLVDFERGMRSFGADVSGVSSPPQSRDGGSGFGGGGGFSGGGGGGGGGGSW